MSSRPRRQRAEARFKIDLEGVSRSISALADWGIKHMLSHINGRARGFYRRDHEKRDGRLLSLYGYQPHEGEAGAEFEDPVSARSEMRFHPLRQEWTLFAPHRQKRTFKPSKAANPLAPARPGAPITEIPFDDFELAVFGNRFPSLHPQAPEPPHAPWTARPATGDAEVIIFSPEDEGSLATLGQERRILLIEALIDRYSSSFCFESVRDAR